MVTQQCGVWCGSCARVPTAATQTSASPTGSAALIYFIADYNLRSACSEESRVCGCAARSERLPATRGRRDAFHRHDQCTPVRLNVPCPHILLLPRVPLPLRILRRTDGRTSPDERLRFRATPCDAASPTAWYPPRHGIPHCMVICRCGSSASTFTRSPITTSVAGYSPLLGPSARGTRGCIPAPPRMLRTAPVWLSRRGPVPVRGFG